jgi:preprotein translocase subunit Sec61beta
LAKRNSGRDTTLIMQKTNRNLLLRVKCEKQMSRKKKENKSPMPAASAGLLRFFEEETEGVKIRPEVLMVLAITLVVVSVLAKIFF